MTFNPTSLFTNTCSSQTRRVWMAPAVALSILAGTSGAIAQDTGFGLNDAMNEQSSNYDTSYNEPEFNSEPASDAELAELDGSVDVNEYDLVDLHVNNEDLGSILQLLSIQSQRNIISSNEVSASITADLYGVTFYEALDSILHVNGFGYIEKGNFIYVYTREQIEEIVRANRTRMTRVVNLDYLNSADAAEFAKQLLSEGGSITTTAVTESFNISDGVPSGADTYANAATLVINDYEENVDEIADLLSQLDTKPAQVLVEATILQTSLNEANAFGMDFALVKNLNFSDFVGTGGPLGVVNDLIGGAGETADGTTVDVTGDNGSGITSTPGGTGGAATLKAGVISGDVAVFMRVLDEITDVTVVSNPKILTLNRQPARVLVGTRVGYLNTTTTETATTQTVEFLDVGTQLAVRPFVSKSGLIRLELRPQVSSYKLREVTDNTGSNVTIPDEDTTEMTTNVMVRDGQTVVLGGLFTETTTASRKQVPLLGDIPLIGNAFKGYNDGTVRSEIIFLITPSIVNDTTLAEAGEMGNQYLEQARYGARKSLLPWSRERRVGQLLIDARNLADEGEKELALGKIDRALRLSPMSPDARQMRFQISNDLRSMPSRSMLDDICESVMGQSVVDSFTTEYDPAVEFESDTDAMLESEVFAEVPVESVSDASSDTDSFNDSEWMSDESAIYAEVETQEFDASDFDSMSESEFSSESEFAAQTDTPEYFESYEPTQDAQFESTTASSETPSFQSNGLYTEVPVDAPFGTASQEADESAEFTEFAPESFESFETADATETFEDADASFESDEFDFTTSPIAADKLSGVLIIPLPSGGALQLDWPMSLTDWSAGSTFTEVPTDGALIDEIAD